MDSRAAIMGHPLHAILVAFPIALWLTAALFDALYVWRREVVWRRGAFWLIAVGEAGCLAAVATGLVDYYLIPMPAEPRAIATRHLFLGLGLLAAYGVQLWLRRSHAGGIAPVNGYPRTLIALTLLTAGLVPLQGGLGGELVFGHRVGVRSPKQVDSTAAGAPNGSTLFREYCAGCHGVEGGGGTGPDLRATRLNLAMIETTVRDGRGMMPPFGSQVSSEQLRSVARFAAELSAE